MTVRDGGSELRTAKLVALLSLATDLGMGQPMEHAQRKRLLGLRLADDLRPRRLGARGRVLRLPARLGRLSRRLVRDGVHRRRRHRRPRRQPTSTSSSGSTSCGSWPVTSARGGHPWGGRGRSGRSSSRAGARWEEFDGTHCAAAGDLALRLGLGPEVRDALQHSFERWDGKGKPAGLLGRGAHPGRAHRAARRPHRSPGTGSAVSRARSRPSRGGAAPGSSIPTSSIASARLVPVALPELDAAPTWEALIEAEPALRPTLSGEELDSALEAVADFGDLKSPYFAGHSRGVAALVQEAAPGYGLPEREAVRPAARGPRSGHRAPRGLQRHPGQARPRSRGGPGARAPAPGPLPSGMLARPPLLAELGALAAMHHERCDGLGYPRGLSGGALPASARLLGATDCYQASSSHDRTVRPGRRPTPRPSCAARCVRVASTGTP